MKKLLFVLVFVLVFVPFIAHTQDLHTYVNPFIGTGGHGHTFPGATAPFGFCQLSPDTRIDGSWDGCGGYHYSDSVIYGFSHTHLSGTGVSDYGDILLMPVTRKMRLDDYQYKSKFLHLSEKAEAGYYRVFLEQTRVGVELTTSRRCGFHKYTFPANADKYVVLDLAHRDELLASKMDMVDKHTIRGYRYSKAWATNQKIFFEIKFEQEIERIMYEPLKMGSKTHAISLQNSRRALIKLKNKKGTRTVKMKVGLSGVDMAGARKNLEEEIPHWDFNKTKKWVQDEWNKELSKIQVSDKSKESISTLPAYKKSKDDKKVIFYSALYHCMIAPNIYSDHDGRYRGRDDKIHTTNGEFDYYTVFSLWDTYRALHPLLTIIDKKRTNDFIKTFIKQYEQGGRLPVWELSSNETNCMIGYHAVSVIWDAYNKGIRDYDAEKAFEAMKSIATEDSEALRSYMRYGYVRAEDDHESVSKTLEYAYDDWCIAQMAKALGKEKDYQYFEKRSHNWINVYDPTTGFMRARKNSTLIEPFSPYLVDNNYTEANSWQYSFYVPHEFQEYLALTGKNIDFHRELLKANNKTEGRSQSDITGLIGQYAHGNEPSHHILNSMNINHPYLAHNDKRINLVLDSFYTNLPNGLIGNEDCGQMSAWYVMNSLGFYQICPGKESFLYHKPLFDFKIKAGNGKLISCDYPMIDTNTYLDWGTNVKSNIDSFSYLDSSINYSITYEKIEKDMTCFVGTNIGFSAPPTIANPYLCNVKRSFNDKEFVTIQTLDQFFFRRTFERMFSNVYYLDTNVLNNMPLDDDWEESGDTTFLLNGALNFEGLEHDYDTTEVRKYFNYFNDQRMIFYSINNGDFIRYIDPFLIKDNAKLNFFVTNGRDSTPIQTATFTKLPDDKEVFLKSKYGKTYHAGGPMGLVDGINGKTNWRAGDWQGYQGQDFEAVIKYTGEDEVETLSANFLQDQRAWIFYPTEVSFYESSDSLNWNLIETISLENKKKRDDDNVSIFKVNTKEHLNGSTTKLYYKVKARNYGALPKWHPGAGHPAYIFIDEIELK